MSCTTKRQSRRSGGEEEEEDRLSSLPDEVLHRILDFTSAKTAMRTGVLSRRWRRVWSSCPNLHFDELEFGQEPGWKQPYSRSFMNFVDRALILSDATNLNRVSVSAHTATDMTRVSSWIYFAVKRNVRDLTFYIKQKAELYLPPPLFRLQSLKRLCFTVFHHQTLHWTRTVSPMPLEDLTLCGVKFLNTARDAISSCCPRLKIWKMERCSGLCQLDVNCPNLETFCLDKCKGLRDLVISAPSLVTIKISDTFIYAGEGASTSLEMSTPKLSKFVWLDVSAHRCKSSSKMFPSSADVQLKSLGGSDLLLSLSETRQMTLSYLSVWSCTWHGPLPDPLFRNLEVLQLLLNSTAMAYVASLMYKSFRCFPNLKTLYIRSVNPPKGRIANEEYLKATIAREFRDSNKQLSLGQLREVGFSDFTGSFWEVEYIKCILGVAPDLQMMTITASDRDPAHNFSQIIEELQTLPSASPRVKLHFKQPWNLLATTSWRPSIINIY